MSKQPVFFTAHIGNSLARLLICRHGHMFPVCSGDVVRRIFPKPVLTVGAMRRSDVEFKMICNVCGEWFKVPVDLIAAAYSDEFSLINKRVGCPAFDCQGSCAVLFQLAENAPFMPLFSRR